MTHPYQIATPLSRRGLLAAGAVSVLLAGCSGGLLSPSQPPPQIYVLQPQFRKLDDAPSVAWQLSVGRPDAPESLQVDRIVLQRGETMDYFADAQWTDPAPRMLQSLLVEAFEASGHIAGVAPDSAGVRADYLLQSELRDFQAEYGGSDAAPDVRVGIVARLLTGRGDVIGTLDAHGQARAAANTVAAVVSAFGTATSDCLENIVLWALKTAPPKPGR